MKNLLVGQSGGPTSVINSTVAGVVSTALASGKVDVIYGAINGIEGVLAENLINLAEKVKSMAEIDLLCQTPAAALGSCRLKLDNPDENEEQFEKIIEVFRRYEIHYFVYIGGNDSMDTVDKLSKYCEKKGIQDITIVGAPKTIDNDLVGTDHCPGFGSAAKYIAVTFSELDRDCSVYAKKAVTIVEVMGRNAGWLTAASALSRVNGEKGPSLIYLCEPAFDKKRFIQDIRSKLETEDAVLVAVSEGIKNADGVYISEEVQSDAVDAFGHSYISGAAKVLEDLVRQEIGCKVRSIELNLMQRCASHIASTTDITEAKMLGMKACQCAIEKKGGCMATVVRKSNQPYEVEFGSIPVCQVSNKEKIVPEDYITADKNDVTDKMMEYLVPLIQGECNVTYENGIPKHIQLY